MSAACVSQREAHAKSKDPCSFAPPEPLQGVLITISPDHTSAQPAIPLDALSQPKNCHPEAAESLAKASDSHRRISVLPADAKHIGLLSEDSWRARLQPCRQSVYGEQGATAPQRARKPEPPGPAIHLGKRVACLGMHVYSTAIKEHGESNIGDI